MRVHVKTVSRFLNTCGEAQRIHLRNPRRWIGRGLGAVFGVIISHFSGSAWAEETAAPPHVPSIPSEERRLDRTQFREGLKRLGLTEILELHIRDYPPSGGVASLLLLRDVKLAEFMDSKRSEEQRRRALIEANGILVQLLANHLEDLRRFRWRFDLAHSLLYEEGEPFATSLLYRGGSRGAAKALGVLAGRSLREVTILQEELAAEYLRIDGLSVGEFEKLERSGFIEEIDRLAPRVDYLHLWALFYDALSRPETDSVRVEELNRIADLLDTNANLLTTPHTVSRIQIQALLLAGMTQRRLNKNPPAREYFDKALGTADRLDDRGEQKRIEWAIRLAWIERVRNESDAGRFDEAFSALRRLRELGHSDAERTGLTIVAALLERSVFRAKAAAAEQTGKSADAKHHRDQAWLALAALARADESTKSALYATLYEMHGAQADLSSLDPVERCAWVSGLLAEAEPDGAKSPKLALAVEKGSQLAVTMPESAQVLAPELVPELRFNVAVAEFRRGRSFEAAREFLEIALQHRNFSRARDAATFAVELGAELFADEARGDRAEIHELYRSALHTLVTDYSDSQKAKYYRFHYAQLLDVMGDYDQAAAQYAFVGPDEELFIESYYLRVRCMASALQRHASTRADDSVGLRHRVNDFIDVQREFVAQCTSLLSRGVSEERRSAIRELMASARVLLAEVQVLPPIDRAGHALDTLDGWENEYGNPKLLGAVWRVRLKAYERLGRLEELSRSISAYLAADPAGAGDTLQALYSEIAGEIEVLSDAGNEEAARRNAEAALSLARKLCEWADRGDARVPDAERHLLTIQLGEAQIQAGYYEDALTLFRSLLPDGVGKDRLEGLNPRIAYDLAEAQYHLKQYGPALETFNFLATKSPPSEPLRWKALLRDLQCRTALNEPAEGVVKVIQQQKFLYPEMGGPALAHKFQQLLKENERRAQGR